MVIGYWLGDGSSSCSAITTDDKEIVIEFKQRLQPYQLTLSSIKNSDITYNIVGIGERYRRPSNNAFLNTLRDLNMLNNKHIPDIYKINSFEVRMALLAGLIDSD